MSSGEDKSVFWDGGAIEQMVPNLEDGNRVLVKVELFVILREGAVAFAPCTERVHGGPSIKEEIVLFGAKFQGWKNSLLFSEGSGSSIDSKGRRLQPLEGIVGCNDPQRTVLLEEGTTSGYFSSSKFSDLKINRSSSKSSTQLFSLRKV